MTPQNCVSPAEVALAFREVQAVILDEAQHLMKVGSGRGAGKLLDQLDWIKSMTNVTGVLHILIGTYELLNFQNLSGQASRRGLEIHFPRYLFQHEQDRLDFQGVLLALLKQVPLDTDIPSLMQEWFYFYERSIGCVGVLKDWLIRTVAATLHDGDKALSLERLSEHALQVGQCERMAIDAIEGEQKLGYMASRKEQLWRLLKMEKVDSSFTKAETAKSVVPTSKDLNCETKTNEEKTTSKKTRTTRKKRSTDPKSKVETPEDLKPESETLAEDANSKPAKTTRKKRTTNVKSFAETSSEKNEENETIAEKVRKKIGKTTRKKRTTNVKSQIPTQEIKTDEEIASPDQPATKKRQTRKKTQNTDDKSSNVTKRMEDKDVKKIVDESEDGVEPRYARNRTSISRKHDIYS